ncbi:hypothetical protein GVAV_002266 [Gurleya vavrai]
MTDLTKSDFSLYDRQIRLFGAITQRKIKNLHVQIISESENLTAGEIIKNLVLLGVIELRVNLFAMNSYKKIGVSELEEINENVSCEIIEEVDLYFYKKSIELNNETFRNNSEINNVIDNDNENENNEGNKNDVNYALDDKLKLNKSIENENDINNALDDDFKNKENFENKKHLESIDLSDKKKSIEIYNENKKHLESINLSVNKNSIEIHNKDEKCLTNINALDNNKSIEINNEDEINIDEKNINFTINDNTSTSEIFIQEIDKTDSLLSDEIIFKNSKSKKIINNNLNYILVLIDSKKEIENAFYICTKCYSFRKKYLHECMKETEMNSVAMECLIGSLFVQEIIKMLSGEESLVEYKIKI